MSGNIEGPAPSRPGSAVNSTRLEELNHCRINDDISARIRSLLLSRNVHNPPRTPYPSDEHLARGSEDSALNHIVSKTIAKAVRREQRLSLPESRSGSAIGPSHSMEILGSPITDPGKHSLKHPYEDLQSSSSANDLHQKHEPGANIEVSQLVDGPSSIPGKRTGRLKLVLADKRKNKDPELISCVEMSSNVPKNDAAVHEEDLTCCPPCSPPATLPSKYIISDGQWPKTIEAERSDLACFLAGCAPGQLNCSKHPSPRRAQSTSFFDRRSRPQETAAIGQDPTADLDKIIAETRARGGMNSLSEAKSAKASKLKSVSGASATSSDAFPHATQSEKIAAKKNAQPPLSTTIFTNFNLPGPKNKRSSKEKPHRTTQTAPADNGEDLPEIKPLEMKPLPDQKTLKKEPKPDDRPMVLIRAKQSDISIKPKRKEDSILSGASGVSSKRHALLKPSVSEAEPVDMGLPVPPRLATIQSFGDSLAIEDAEEREVDIVDTEILGTTVLDPDGALSTKIDKARVEVGPDPVAGHLENLQKTIDLVDNVSQRVQDVKQNVQKKDTNGRFPYPSRKAAASPPAGINPIDAAYWGFVPEVKGKVEDAVQFAVRNAVQDIVFPPGVPKTQATNAYRSLMADSLTNAAKNADDYLKRSSVWNAPNSSHGNPPASSFKGKEMAIGNAGAIQKPKNVFQPGNDLESIPLDLAAIIAPENQKQGQSTHPSPIPNRSSSKNKVLGTKTVPKLSPRDSPKEDQQSEACGRYVLAQSAISALPSRKILQPLDDRSTISNIPPGRQIARKNTVHWLRELLSSKGPYEPQLTALPPRTQRANKRSGVRGRSLSDPARNADDLYDDKDRIDDEQGQQIGRAIVPENFTRTIDDLEQLLNEALLIARLAADKDDSAPMPAILGDAARILQTGRKGLTEGYQPRRNMMRSSRRSDTYSVELSDIGSMHESLRSYSVVTDSDDPDEYAPYTYRDSQNRSLEIPAKNPRRKQAGKATPFPTKRSGDDIEAEVPLMITNKNVEYIKNADPRSMPAEIDFARGSRNSRKYSPPEDDLDPPEALGELIGSGPPPKFYNPEPFKSPASTGTARRFSPERSPRQLSPSKENGTGKNVPTIVTNDQRPLPLPKGRTLSKPCQTGDHSRDDHAAIQAKLDADGVPSKGDVRNHIKTHHHPPIHARDSSLNAKKQAEQAQENAEGYQLRPGQTFAWQDIDQAFVEPCTLYNEYQNKQKEKKASTLSRSLPCTSSMDGSEDSSGQLDFSVGYVARNPDAQAGAGYRAAAQRQATGASNGNRGYLTGLNGNQRSNQPGQNAGYSPVNVNENGGYPSGGDDGGGGGYPSKDPNGNEGNPNGHGDPSRYELRDEPYLNLPQTQKPRRRKQGEKDKAYALDGKNHLSLRSNQHKGFSFAKSHKKPKISRDWHDARKRFCATVACISTALVGILVGIYAGEVPAIQYYIVDLHHYTVLGNVFFYLGLAVPTFFCWPLPLLHGRKPYILGAMALAMPLLFPQAVAVGSIRSPYVRYWRVALIMPRGLMGLCLGFANMNFKSTLTDLFGASLQSTNPHQEVVDENDVRRHGGGLGVWLGLWTWSAMGSIGVGFMIGALVINHLPPAWGFYTSIFIIAGVLLLNIITPEVRRSAFRRSVAEVKDGEKVSRRLARGEVKMHMVKTGPKWWGEELHYGYILSLKMLSQPGFLIMALYVAWMYAQIVLIIILLGSLVSNKYRFTSPYVGLSVCSVPLGAMIAIPFQKASIFSRSKSKDDDSDDATYTEKIKWSDHTVRRMIFILVLPFAGLGYTLSSTGPPIHYLVPILFAGLIGFLSNLAMAECHGILMETFDTSDLSPGMAGRARGSAGEKAKGKRTNYSSFPRVASAFAITQALGYVFSAVSIAVGGSATRQLGQQAATGVMAGILLVLSILLLGVLFRFKDVQVIPDSKKDDMSRWQNARKTSAFMRAQGAEAEEPWRPIIIGNPTHHTRRMNVLEMGSLTRFEEIRRKNRLVDANSLEAMHPNLVVIEDVEERFFGKKPPPQRQMQQVPPQAQQGPSQGYPPYPNSQLYPEGIPGNHQIPNLKQEGDSDNPIDTGGRSIYPARTQRLDSLNEDGAPENRLRFTGADLGQMREREGE